MSFYEPQSWQAPARQPSWEQPPPPSRSGASSSSQREDGNAFITQFEEVDQAIDNLVKSGKLYLPGGPKRDSMPLMVAPGRPYPDHGHRVHGSRHSVSDVDPSRSFPAANVQNFYASQRQQGRHGEPEQMLQAKRRMAQQRERDLRNYHQEQQYNRSVLADMTSNQSERSMSPSAQSEEGRRELIARQHRALYGSEGAAFIPQAGFGEDGSGREQTGSSKAQGPRGPSPRGIDRFGQPQQQGDGSGQEAGRPDKGDSSTNPATVGFNKAPTPPTGDESSHSRQLSKSTTAPLTGSMAPIGSRPTTQHAPGQSLNKRTTSPLPSALTYGFGSTEQNNERSGSSNSNNNTQKENTPNPGMGTWGTGSGVWGSNKIGATSVWG